MHHDPPARCQRVCRRAEPSAGQGSARPRAVKVAQRLARVLSDGHARHPFGVRGDVCTGSSGDLLASRMILEISPRQEALGVRAADEPHGGAAALGEPPGLTCEGHQACGRRV